MRNIRGLVMIVASIIAGLTAMLLATRWLVDQTTVATNKVAVAAIDLEVGQRITAQQVKLIDWPAGSVPAGVFNSAEALDGRVTKVNVLRDEPILEPKLAAKGTTGGLSSFIADGKRAITVRVNDVVGVAGFALPGNFVDVIVNTQEDRDGATPRVVSKIVLEKILVLAIAQETARDDTKPRVVNAVTLEVTPLEAEKIDLARSVGTLSLVLRNQVDSNPAQTTGATKEVLLGKQAPVRPPAAPAAVPSAPRIVTVVKAPEPPPKPAAKRTCVDALVGSERVAECF